MHRIAVIVNTRSRSPFAGKFLRKRIASIRTHPWLQHTQLFFTAQAGDAEKLSRRALEQGFDIVMSMGGDGTHNEVVNGFFDHRGGLIRASACLAVLPGGTGEDFRKTLGIGRSLTDGLHALRFGRARPMDVGVIRYRGPGGKPMRRRFINIASVGLSGLVDRFAADPRFQWLGGRGVYMLATVRAFLRFRNPRLRIRIDGEPERVQRACAFVIANGRYFGGGMQVAPCAYANDRRFDAVCLGDFRVTDFLFHGHRLYRGAHLAMPKVWMQRARELRVDSETPVPIDVDGEAAGSTPVAVSMASERISVFTAGPHGFISGTQSVQRSRFNVQR